MEATKEYDHFNYWLKDKCCDRNAKIYLDLEEDEAMEILQPIFKAKNVDSNTSQHSLEEEKYHDHLTQGLTEDIFEMKSMAENVNTLRPRRINHMLDSDGNIDELAAHMDEINQINSRAFTHNIRNKLSNFRIQYLEPECPDT